MSAQAEQESIAIIGMFGRFPQAADLDTFWKNLRAGAEAISFFQDEEVQWLPIENRPDVKDPAFVKARGVLERAEWFDAGFFNLNPREAAVMDPQHRVFLECCWEALENAGCNPDTFPGQIGVFAGASLNTYLFTNLLTNPGLLPEQGFFSAMIANSGDFVPTRVSYKLNLRGPSLNVQTACSTSLVAVCLACQNLLGYRCDAALAGGVSITFPPHRGQRYQPGGIMSPDGHCRAFDARGAGTVLGDGAGVVLLKRLSDALADGDPIRAIIKGSAINNDGSLKIGYTAPSSDGQAEAIALAQAEAGVAPETISYVEAHGTATPLGDPIEIAGLTKAFGAKPGTPPFCAVGSVKSNIGHLDVAAGVAGLIKTVLALEHGEIPPSLHFEKPNPQIDFAHSPFFVNATLRPWTRGDTPRRAGVSSFGIGGTNAHVVLEEAPPLNSAAPSRATQLLVLSARTPTALEKTTDRLLAHLQQNPAANLADIAFTLQTGRKKFTHRRAIACTSTDDAIATLAHRTTDRIHTWHSDAAGTPVAFLFPGQGAQRVNMTRDLYATEPVFRERVDHCSALLQPLLGRDLRALLYPDPERLEDAGRELAQTLFTQPALFTVEYALARLWMSWGIQPQAMLGHSLGEYVAACLAGVFSLETALKLVVARARLMQAQPPGAMLAVPLTETELKPLLAEERSLDLAAVNTPQSCVVSGPVEAISAFETKLGARSLQCRRLATSHAFHSAMMDAVLAPFASELDRASLHAPEIPVVSNRTGRWLTAAEATDPTYWTAHLRNTVRFADGLAQLFQHDRPALLELGPGHTLAQFARLHPAAGPDHPIASAQSRPDPAIGESIANLSALGRLWCAGVAIDWKKIHGNDRRLRVALPTYPFERERHWIEPGAAFGFAAMAAAPAPETTLVKLAAAPLATLVKRPLLIELQEIFKKLSGIDLTRVPASTNFIDLGFDSLFLARATQAVKDRFGTALTFRQLLDQYSSLEKLAAHLETTAAGAAAAPSVSPQTSAAAVAPALERVRTVPLTEAQREIWFATQLGEAVSAAYNESCTVRLHGEIDADELREALERLVVRHEALRTTFDPAGDVQLIATTGHVDLKQIDLSDEPAVTREAKLRSYIETTLAEPFDLRHGPLWRVRLARLAPDESALLVVVHHLICDGWSLRVLIDELGEIYTALWTGAPVEVHRADQFGDYATELPNRATKDNEAYWLSQFADSVPTLDLPTDRPRPATRTYAGGHASRELRPEITAAVRKLSSARNATSFTVLLTAFTALLHRLSGQDDLVVGTPAAAQVLGGHETLVGHCVNLLPMRSRLGDEESFGDFLSRTRQTIFDAFDHWQHPFAALLRQLNLPRDPNRVPLASTTFNLGRLRGSLRFADAEAEFASNPKRFVNFDLSFNLAEMDRLFVLDCYYSSELFDAATIERILDRYELILLAAAADLEQPVHRLPLLTDAERQLVLSDWNRTLAPYRRDRCLHQLFAEQVARTPDALAVADESTRLTYRELHRRATTLARRLQAENVAPETCVAVCIESSVGLPIAFLAVMQAGAAYVPLDPSSPPERLAFMIRDSGATALVTQKKFSAVSASAAIRAVFIDAVAPEALPPLIDSAESAENLAYVIYTSGSTGTPKGVAIRHASVANLLAWHHRHYQLTPADRVTQFVSPAFDACGWEIWPALTAGASVHFPNPETRLSPGRIVRWLAEQRITVSFLPTPLAEAVMDETWPADTTLRALHTGGDRLRRWPNGKLPCALINLYGPTECTIVSTAALVPSESDGGAAPNIGTPIANTQVYVLDRHLELVPPGLPGELCLGGDGLARGYLNQPELTVQKFIKHPFSSAPGARLYRTGDLVRQRADGSLEFLGRIDHQVKIRGYRIELGEIEATLSRHPHVKECVVLARSDGPEKHLAAYLVPAPSAVPDSSGLRQFLAQKLPEHMIPATFGVLDRMPLTSNGKIDRRALPQPGDAASARRASTPPRTTTEEVIAEIWRDVLGIEQFGVHDNFFELGGHSLLVTRVLARLDESFHLQLPLRRAFEAPTVAELAAAIEDALVDDIKALTESGPEAVPTTTLPVQ